MEKRKKVKLVLHGCYEAELTAEDILDAVNDRLINLLEAENPSKEHLLEHIQAAVNDITEWYS